MGYASFGDVAVAIAFLLVVVSDTYLLLAIYKESTKKEKAHTSQTSPAIGPEAGAAGCASRSPAEYRTHARRPWDQPWGPRCSLLLRTPYFESLEELLHFAF